MTIYESEIPGVGKKFEVELDGEERLVIIIHHDGRREVFRRPSETEDSVKLFSLTGRQARKVGSILEGAYFQPVELEDVQVPLGEAIIEWIEVGSDSPLVGQTLREADVRQRTGASVMAIQRGDETIANPTPDVTIRADDIVVVLGTREEQSAFASIIERTDETA